MANREEAYMVSSMASNKRETAGLRAAGRGAVKCSADRRINQLLEFSCICYERKKKYGKWRLVTELSVINKVIQSMGSLQPGIPFPFMLL